MNLEHSLHDGAPRPRWAGAVHVRSSERPSTRGEVSRLVELKGLVLPVSLGRRRIVTPDDGHLFGAGIGFPNLREHFGHASHGLWQQWHKLESAVGEAAASVMGWNGARSTHEAASSARPEHALELLLHGRSVQSTNARRAQVDSITGEVRKMFAIRSVTGSQVRFESAGASAPFRLTANASNWSRDPRSL